MNYLFRFFTITAISVLIIPISLAKQDVEFRIVAAEHSLLQYPVNGRPVGPTVDILKGLLYEANLIEDNSSPDVDFMPWPRAYEVAVSTPNTIILSIIRMPEREEKFHWIGVTSELSRVFISLKDKPENLVSSDEQAKEKLVAVTRKSNSFNELIAKGFEENKNLYIVPWADDAFKLLVNGRVDLVYNDPNAVQSYIAMSENRHVEVTYNPVVSKNRRASYIAISKNSDKTLVNILKKAMENFTKTSAYRHLLTKKGDGK